MSKKLSKEKMKEFETPEEKRQRRLNKKLAKNRKAMEKMGWDEEYRGYTNSDNPFGDEFLLETCVWKKKLEKEGRQNMMEHDVKKLQKLKMIENKRELEKVKKRRMEREAERSEREKEQEMMQRDKEAVYFRQWERQEDSFHLQQAKLRSKIRVEEGRAKPIDLLAQYINNAEDDDTAVEVTEPYNLLNGLTVQDLEDLIEDIKVYLQLEQGRNCDFWKDITMVTEEEMIKLKKLDPNCPEFIDRRSSISQSVMADIEKIFRGKTLNQLHQLEVQIHQKLKGGQGIDVGYWESLSEQLKYHMARQRLRERHQELLRHKLYKLKKEQCIENEPLFPIKDSMRKSKKIQHDEEEKDENNEDERREEEEEDENEEENEEEERRTEEKIREGEGNEKEVTMKEEVEEEEGEEKLEPSTSSAVYEEEKLGTGSSKMAKGGENEEKEDEFSEDELSYREYSQASYSPKLIHSDQLPAGIPAIDWLEDFNRLQFARKQVMITGQAERDEEEELIRRAKVGMNADEAQFSVEIPLKPEVSAWSDKYRPRKPRFFNRVHTGFEWNKYNQTHYDIDNPPPKIVQGYKFNIFYPDLIDKSNSPEYKLLPCPDNKDFVILRFSASAPYEDIAFKIVNREWEQSSRRGFRCQFQNNILQLWFHFKRFRYRR